MCFAGKWRRHLAIRFGIASGKKALGEFFPGTNFLPNFMQERSRYDFGLGLNYGPNKQGRCGKGNDNAMDSLDLQKQSSSKQ